MSARGRWLALLPGLLALLLAATPAFAHNLPAAEVARLNAWVAGALDGGWAGLLLLVGGGLALGALHGLEPGHAKTMMSAFIIAIGGTVGQAVLLGAAATVSHTAVVWLLVVPVLIWGGGVDFAGEEPYFQIASALAVLAVAGWTVVRVWRERPAPVAHSGATTIDTGHGLARLAIETVDGAPRFVLRGVARSGREIPFHEDVTVRTERAGGAREVFGFVERDGAKISDRPVPAPHDFRATICLSHDNHGHAVAVPFGRAPAVAEDEHADAHARAHAEALARELAGGRRMTNWRVVLFGLGGGLLPCPAAITVLLLCLHLRRLGLGLLLVGSFSLGLALTMIAAGTVAALGARHLSRRMPGVAALARPATYASVALIVAIGVYMLVQGIDALA
jgi:nickel/cobalt exporter